MVQFFLFWPDIKISMFYVIQMLDPDAKSLVFSTWTDVLDILASALAENDIQFAALQDQGKFKRNLEKFKVKLEKNYVLLTKRPVFV